MSAAAAVHRSIVCVDVERFCDRGRTNAHQAEVREGMYRALRLAFAGSGVPWPECYREDRGDGALILVPPDVPKSRLVTGVPRRLAEALTEHNRRSSRPAAIRLRLAVHAGEVLHDDHGVVGAAINVAFRLLEADPLKRALADSSGSLAMIASQWFFEEVIRHDPAACPELFRRARVSVKETSMTGWICLPDAPYPAVEDARPLAGATGLPVPRQLPADTAVFVGREDSLVALDQLPADRGESRAAVTAVIAGGAGVGKTTLAVYWAHRVRTRFPDGELFVDLRGYDPGRPVQPLEALDGFLRALDLPAAKIPADLAGRAALFRSILAGRRMLIVLDNARGAEQVRPLLPGAAGCLVLITSRSRLSGLVARDGAVRLSIDVLDEEQSVDLLRRIIGAGRIHAEPDRAAEIARRCARLPLALRIAADRAAGHPRLRLADLVADLADERDRLDVLAAGDDEVTAVRAVFSWSYRRLPYEASRAFRLLGLHAGADLAVPAVAALLGARPQRLLDTLVGQHLLEHVRRDRYRFHDLLRAYAAECAELEEPRSERAAATERLLTWYLRMADAAYALLVPHGYRVCTEPLTAAFQTQDEALRWFEDERGNLVAAVRQAAAAGLNSVAWRLAHPLTAFLNQRWYPADWLEVVRIGQSSARRIDCRQGMSLMLLLEGTELHELGQYEEALERLSEALPLSREAGEPWIEGFCRSELGRVNRELERFDTAADHLERAVAIFRAIPQRRGEGIALTNLAGVHIPLGRLDSAIELGGQAARILDETGNHDSRASALQRMGHACRELKRFDEATDHYRQALSIMRGTRDLRQLGSILCGLAETHFAAEDVAAARQCWREAHGILADMDHRRAALVEARLNSTA